MAIVFLYLIPFVIGGIFHIFFNRKIAIHETILMFLIPTGIIGIIHIIMMVTATTDTESTQSIMTKARYVEKWETYEYKICQSCTTDSKGKQSCTDYDCSYCDTHDEYYEAEYDNGDTKYISRADYLKLVNEFKPNSPYFVDKNRKITKSFGCGIDGDAYEIQWNGVIENSHSKFNYSNYENPILVNRNAFNYKEYTDEEIEKQKLIHPKHNTNVVMYNTNLLRFNSQQLDIFERYVNFYNTELRKINGSQIVYIFTQKPIEFAVKQRDIWLNGKRNQMIIVIGLKGNKIQYVHNFSWSKNKKIQTDIKYDIMELGTIDNPYELTKITFHNMKKFVVRDMNDYSYLSHTLSNTQLVALYILMVIISLIGAIYFVANDDDYEEPYKQYKYR